MKFDPGIAGLILVMEMNSCSIGIIADINRHSSNIVEIGHIQRDQDVFTSAGSDISDGCCGVLGLQ